MKPALRRLKRLHALRGNLADAASLRVRELDGNLQEARDRFHALQKSTDLSESLSPSSCGDAWLAYTATCELAVRLQAVTTENVGVLQVRRAAAVEAQQQAMMAREQMARLTERCRIEADACEVRSEQLRLDEGYASALFRRNLPTRF